jgi:hypothetical protein
MTSINGGPKLPEAPETSRYKKLQNKSPNGFENCSNGFITSKNP